MMKYLYLFLNIASLLIPLVVSFHPRLKFYKKWPALALSTLITGLFFIVWDVIFTNHGIWGFNASYLIGIDLLNLPIEEWLFFICIPYACVFTYYALLELLPNFSYSEKWFRGIFATLLFVSLALAITYNKRWYTFVNYSYFAFVLVLVYLKNSALLKSFFVIFLSILLPFFLVNGILTGSFIDGEVVWYDNSHNLGIRLFTIPIEDMAYAFSLVLTNLFLLELFQGNNK